MTLGKRIGMLRREKKLSQEFLAESLNVSRQAVSKWENDLSSPDTENLIALAKLLEVDVDFLATGELTEQMESDQEPESPEPQRTPKVRRPLKCGKRLMAVLLAIALCLSGVLYGLWVKERNDHSELEELAQYCANSANKRFEDYRARPSDFNFNYGVSEFVSFYNAYFKLTVEKDGSTDSNVLYINQLIADLMFEPEEAKGYIDELIQITNLLEADIYDDEAYRLIFSLHNQLSR